MNISVNVNRRRYYYLKETAWADSASSSVVKELLQEYQSGAVCCFKGKKIVFGVSFATSGNRVSTPGNRSAWMRKKELFSSNKKHG